MIRWDMRGHARSDSPDDPSLYGKHHQVADMKALLDHCGGAPSPSSSSPRAVLVGHSMGAYDHMLFHLVHPGNCQKNT